MTNHLLNDKHNRTITKLRFSLNEACNLNCLYCRPSSTCSSKKSDLLSTDEIFEIISNFTSFGIDHVRFTGGEPTLRHDFIDIIKRVSEVSLKSIGITTNAINLNKYLPELAKTKCNKINVSLDSLEAKNYKQITGKDCLKTIIETLNQAQNLGFKLKINVVVLKGINDHEIIDFANFAATMGIEIRFLEIMRIGISKEQFQNWFISTNDLIKRLEEKFKLVKLKDTAGATAFHYLLNNGAKIGFIASETKSFCHECNRIRVNAKGEVRPCLMLNKQVNLRGLPLNKYSKLLRGLIDLKPMVRIKHVDASMQTIGG